MIAQAGGSCLQIARSIQNQADHSPCSPSSLHSLLNSKLLIGRGQMSPQQQQPPTLPAALLRRSALAAHARVQQQHLP